MVGGAKQNCGTLPEDWSSHVYERIGGKWIEIRGLAKKGKPHYIETIKLPTSTDFIEMTSNKTYEMEAKCITMKSPCYSDIYSININFTFPDIACWNVSMRIQTILNFSFNESCNDSSMTITVYGEDTNNVINIDQLCGNWKTYVKFLQLKQEQILDFEFKGRGQGFLVKLCKEECCYLDGKPHFWQIWGEWSYPNTCPYKASVNEEIKKRERKCKSHCKCNQANVEMDSKQLEINTGNRN